MSGINIYGLLLTCLTVLLSVSPAAKAQLNFDYTEGKIMIKGHVSDLKSDDNVPNANIWITNQKKGTTADVAGNFTMYVYPTDTLRFSSLGFIPKVIPVSAIPEHDRYTISIGLVQDIYSLQTVTIYPFHNRNEFIQAFVNFTGSKKALIDPTLKVVSKSPHKEKARFYNPISAIYNSFQKSKSVADPNFKP